MDVGSLEGVMHKQGPLPEPILATLTIGILNGLIYLFETHRIVHRGRAFDIDIKPSNILLASTGQVKIADFGVSKELVNGTMAMTFTGTQGYLAPERIREGNNCSPVADVWSLGLALIELATGKFPFPPEAMASVLDLLNYIKEEPSPSLPPGYFTPSFHEFIQASLIKDPNQRPGPRDMLAAPFIQAAGQAPADVQGWIASFK